MNTFLFRGVVSIIFCFLQTGVLYAANDQDDSHWYNGFSITPGAGFRHLGFDVTRKSDGYTGNISNAGLAQSVFALDIGTPSLSLNQGGEIKLEIHSYTALLSLDHQFYKDGSTLPTGADGGERVDVGTSVDGYYSYILPTIKLEYGTASKFALALGVGYWVSRYSGDIILTPDDRPDSSMTRTLIDVKNRKEPAYLFTKSWQTESNWIFLMSVGGTKFEDSLHEYKVEEVALIFGKRFVF